jgi:hypothetical protein
MKFEIYPMPADKLLLFTYNNGGIIGENYNVESHNKH